MFICYQYKLCLFEFFYSSFKCKIKCNGLKGELEEYFGKRGVYEGYLLFRKILF